MRQKLSLQNIMVQLRQRWESLPDGRMPNNNTKYTIVDGVLAAFAVFFMQSSSFLAHQRLLQSKKGIISKMGGGKRDRANPMRKKDNEVNYRGYV